MHEKKSLVTVQPRLFLSNVSANPYPDSSGEIFKQTAKRNHLHLDTLLLLS